MLELLADPDTRAAYGAAGRRRILARYSWDSVAAATEEVYLDVLAGRARAAAAATAATVQEQSDAATPPRSGTARPRRARPRRAGHRSIRHRSIRHRRRALPVLQDTLTRFRDHSRPASPPGA